MASIAMNDIYTKICGALNTLGGLVKWYEINMNQNKKQGEGLPVDFPAVIFAHHDVLWENTGLPRQGLVELQVQVIHQIKDNQELLKPQSAGRNDEIRRNQDLLTINNVIEGLSAPTFNSMTRLNNKEEFDNENLLVINTSNYYCNIMSDNSAPALTLTIDFTYVSDMNQLLNRNKCCK